MQNTNTQHTSIDDYRKLAERILSGHRCTAEEALNVLRCSDAETFGLVEAASRLRRHYFGNSVKVNYLVNLKSGMCPEDCTYCSQRLGSDADVLKYSWITQKEAVKQATYGISGGAARVCMVASGRGPSDREVERVSDMVQSLKREHPAVEVCACLGKLKEGQAERLKSSGVDAYNHNLNTAQTHYEKVCTTHTYDDRVETIERAHAAGLSLCSGLIVGMDETDEQIVEAALALRDMDADSIPVNFLMPFEGTPLAGHWTLTPLQCLRILAMIRLVAPEKELRMAGGRELHLRSLQPVALQVVNSLFLGDYLTSEGQGAVEDLRMIRDSGFEVLRAEGRDLVAEHERFLAKQQGCGDEEAGAGGDAVTVSVNAVMPRKRGPGTAVAPNA